MTDSTVAVTATDVIERGVQRTVLPNGLTVLSEHMPGVRSVSFGAWVCSASLHEPREKMGVSHLLEHMVFKGTERRSARELALALEALGGSLDAYTGREHTSFQARVLDEHLPQAADVLFDLMFRPVLRDADLQLERKVVLEEIAMVDDTPDDVVFELHNALLWGPHPFGYSILGTADTVSALSTDDLRALHARAYRPSQVVVAAAGNVVHEHLLDVMATAGWNDLPGDGGVKPGVPAARTMAPEDHTTQRDTQQMHLVFGNAVVPYGDPRRHALMLVNSLFGGGMSSRLFQRVREELGLAYSVQSFQSFHAMAGAQGIYVGCAPERADEAVSAVLSELSALAVDGIPDEELLMGKQQLKGQITLSMESVGARMYRAAAVELYDEPYRELDEVLARVDAITTADVRDVCREFYKPEAQTILRLGPQAAASRRKKTERKRPAG
ncbi:MAG TPA: pitrilysin family protein [Gemmatimonadaceae bacterium]|nr:pitrilysin family protein [Gemmatimonadaceae bacterium]